MKPQLVKPQLWMMNRESASAYGMSIVLDTCTQRVGSVSFVGCGASLAGLALLKVSDSGTKAKPSTP